MPKLLTQGVSLEPKNGRQLIGIVAGFKSERWPVIDRNAGRLHLGIRILSSGCPLDLDPAAFPVGMCTRTLFAGVEIVLWHTEPDRFRLEHQRSVAGCVHAMLAETARELEAG